VPGGAEMAPDGDDVENGYLNLFLTRVWEIPHLAR